jgi:hypothetical protein
MEINQYPLESFAFQDEDYYDIDFWTGSGYQTKKILGSVIKAGILAAVENIYNTDGTLTGSRAVNIDGNILSFISNNQGEFEVIIGNGISEFSKFSQTLAQIFLQIQGSIPSNQLNFDLNPINTQLTINDGVNYASLQVNGVGSALNFTDGVSQYRVEANENGVVINSSYILPNVDGTAGQVMTTDGAGVASWQDAGTSTISWGDIVGTLADQTDLQSALDAKLDDPNGLASQYIRGDGTVADFPIVGGGGSAVTLYLNGGTNQGTFGGGTYYQLSQNAILATNADFNLNADGLIAQFITDVNEPNQLIIPAGNWIFGTYFSASSGGGSPQFYIELLKYDGSTFTSIASSVSNPEGITNGTAIDIYYSALAVPQTTLSATDRIAVRVYVIHSGRTLTLHTQDNHLSQVTTTFSVGLTALNGLTEQVQFFQVGTSGTDFAINSSSSTHSFNLPTASAANRGALSSSDWTAFNNKADDNIYSADGTLTGTRAVDLDGEAIYFQDAAAAGGAFIVNIDNGTKLSSLALNPNVFDLELINAGVGSVIIGTSTDLLLRHIGAIANKQIKINNTGIQINEVYYLPNADGTNGQVIRTNGSGSLSFQSLPAEIQAAASDETTNLTIGTSKVTFRMPHAMTLTAVRASLSTAQAAGAIFTVDINQNGGSILGTKLTIDNNEKTSTTAATPATIVTSALTDDAEITIDIDQVGTALAKGLKITLIGTRA